MSFTQTMECLIDGLGQATGEAIRTEINNLLGMPNVDLTALQQAVAQIQALLDADPGTAGFQTGQNIITQLVALGNRIDSLENSTVVAQLQVLVNGLSADLAAETLARQQSDDALQSAITSLTSQVENLSSQVSTIANSTGGDCDCAAIAVQISDLQNSVANLTGTDAAQAAQIANLQDSLSTMAGTVAAATAAATAAQIAAANAATAAANAAAVAAAAQAAVDALDTREQGHHNHHHGRLTSLEAFQAEVNAADCVALTARFRTAISAGLASGV